MNPIGAFNQNRDGPKWSLSIAPSPPRRCYPPPGATVGFGLYGKYFKNDWTYGYELCLTNGFDDRIVSNVQNKTFLPATKENADRFEESFNGVPLLTAKTAVRKRGIGGLAFRIWAAYTTSSRRTASRSTKNVASTL